MLTLLGTEATHGRDFETLVLSKKNIYQSLSKAPGFNRKNEYDMTDKERSKKRKRHSETQDVSHKKAVAATSTPRAAFSSVKVKHIQPEKNTLGPIVGEQ
jgi:hypothetical protein